MTDRGKIGPDLFDRVVAPNLGADRPDVALGPSTGVDFGVLAVSDDAVVVSTDPLSVLARLGYERAARLATDIVLADVAVSGCAPSHLAVALTVGTEWGADDVAATCRGIESHARDCGVTVGASHVGRYPTVDTSWIGGATALGHCDPATVVRPDGAAVGDDLVIATGPGAETAGLLASVYPDALDLEPEDLAAAQDRVEDIYAVEDALVAHAAGDVSAMHDATEGGVVGGLCEMATGAGVRFDVDRESVPVRDGVAALCGAAGVDPWHVTSCGTLLIAAPPGEAAAVAAALEARGTPAAVVGTVAQGRGVYLDGDRVTAPDTDPSWAAWERLARANGGNA